MIAPGVQLHIIAPEYHGMVTFVFGWFMTCMALVGLKQSADALSASWRFIQFRWTIQSQW